MNHDQLAMNTQWMKQWTRDEWENEYNMNWRWTKNEPIHCKSAQTMNWQWTNSSYLRCSHDELFIANDLDDFFCPVIWRDILFIAMNQFILVHVSFILYSYMGKKMNEYELGMNQKFLMDFCMVHFQFLFWYSFPLNLPPVHCGSSSIHRDEPNEIYRIHHCNPFFP